MLYDVTSSYYEGKTCPLARFGYDRDGMSAFFGRFIDLYENLYNFPKPVVAALSGHSAPGASSNISAYSSWRPNRVPS